MWPLCIGAATICCRGLFFQMGAQWFEIPSILRDWVLCRAGNQFLCGSQRSRKLVLWRKKDSQTCVCPWNFLSFFEANFARWTSIPSVQVAGTIRTGLKCSKKLVWSTSWTRPSRRACVWSNLVWCVHLNLAHCSFFLWGVFEIQCQYQPPTNSGRLENKHSGRNGWHTYQSAGESDENSEFGTTSVSTKGGKCKPQL